MPGRDTSLCCPLDGPVSDCTCEDWQYCAFPRIKNKVLIDYALLRWAVICVGCLRFFEGWLKKRIIACEVDVAYTRMYFYIRNLLALFFFLFSLLRALLESHM